MPSQDNRNNLRCDYLDCVKGLCILCITFLHFENGVIPAWLNVWIGLFMITSFYFTSGYVFALKQKVDSPQELFKKRILQLGRPYLWFVALILCFDLLFWAIGWLPIDRFAADGYKAVTLRGIGTLWFLPVLFLTEIIFSTVATSKRPWLVGGIFVILTLTVSYLYYDIWLQYRDLSLTNKLIDSPMRPIAQSLSAWPVMGFGFLMGRHASQIHSTRPWALILFGFVALAISIWFVIAPPFYVEYVNSYLSFTLPTIGFIGIFAVIADTYIGRFFKYWGKNSLILMCTHFSITMEVIMAFDACVMHNKDFTGVRTIIYFIIAVIITYPLVGLFNGPLKFMLGRKK